MRRVLVAVVTGLMMTATSVFAADEDGALTVAPTVVAAATSLAAKTELAAALDLAARYRAPRRPALLPGLYATSAFLQGYDAYSTLTVLKSGGHEANPLMQSMTKSPATFVALKAGVTMAAIMSAERMWKDNHRVAAVAMMVVSNGMMAVVARHNAAVLQRVR